MGTLNFIKDKDFLRALDNDINKFFFVKIEILDSNEIPIRSIEGIVQPGSVINISGNSSVRRTCNLNVIAEEKKNDLTDINYFLSVNKRIRLFEGFKNNVSTSYDEYVWFPLGIFVIVQPVITHNVNGCNIQLSCKDKMCLLNGECAGNLPTSITFDSYDQIIGSYHSTILKNNKFIDINPTINTTIVPNNYTIYYYDDIKDNKRHYYSWTKEYGWVENEDGSSIGERISIPQRMYDIIQTLVCNYGGIDINKIFINDVPLQIKQIVRYVGTGILYFNILTSYYTTDAGKLTEGENVWKSFNYGDDVGYQYTDFVYPGSLVSSIGDNVCTILDRIKNALGNYEYFFDLEGNFVFQEIRNYLNHSYNVVDKYRLDQYNNEIEISGTELKKYMESNNVCILDETNYKMDIHSNSKSVYTFTEGSGLITSFSNTPNFNNLKNDFHVWGENNNGYPIHYHLVIKRKPTTFNKYIVIYEIDKNGNTTGKVKIFTDNNYKKNLDTLIKLEEEYNAELEKILNRTKDSSIERTKALDKLNEEYFEKTANVTKNSEAVLYTPTDWRAELYLQGLLKKEQQSDNRPDIYEQELLDLFDDIYDFQKKEFKTDLVYHPNALQYFFDYIEPSDNITDCSVDALGPKVYSYKQDKLNRLYNMDIPNVIILDKTMNDKELATIKKQCEYEGQPFTQTEHKLYTQLALGTTGYTAQEVARELLYQYTNYNESISIQSIPIYYLDVNTRITVEDNKSGLAGDYIINTISLPLNAGNVMTINATRALERI